MNGDFRAPLLNVLPRSPSPPQDASKLHVRGVSEFIDDRPPVAGELQVGVIGSIYAHARILGIDTTAALAVPGVLAVYSARDFHENMWGTIFKDQPLLADDVARYAGEPVAVVAATSREALAAGKAALRVDYEVLPAILSIDEAREAKSFIAYERRIVRGDTSAAFAAAPHVFEGRTTLQGQDHFYLESQACIAYPKEDGQVEIHASSQHPTEVQHLVAHALGVPFHSVVCIVRRMGGGFGGKESQGAPFAAYAALAATRLGRAARVVLSKDDDMIITGKRNPFQNDWKVAVDAEGRLLGLEVRFWSDGGAYADLSTSIMERAMLHADNAYYLPAATIIGQVCRTHNHPHTAFRGFGGPKGVATIEAILEEVAHRLGLDALDVRKRNAYGGPGRDVTHYGQRLENNLMPGLFETLEARCDYRVRRAQIDAHNSSNTETLRGLSLTAVKFGISFTTRFLNQGNALVNVHQDGTVQVGTGATEMGQGVNMKIAQVVAGAFGVDVSAVRVMPTNTEKNHNTSPTAASSGTDLNAQAALIACERIRERLLRVAAAILPLPVERRPSRTAGLGTEVELTDGPPDYRDGDVEYGGGEVWLRRDPACKIRFSDLCREAFLSRVQLGDYAFFRIPGIAFDKLSGQGDPFFYFTQGVAAAEVEIDRYTGENKVRRVDVLMDLGQPINRGIDIGQIQGAFVQGMGWVTTENLVYDKGFLMSHSPSTYKIPNVQDTPRIFNVDLVENTGNTKNVGGSKAVGEPPLLLATCVWTAIQDALNAVRPPDAPVRLPVPATLETILHLLPEPSA